MNRNLSQMLRTHSTLWILFDGKMQILGRLALMVQHLLLGKGKPIYAGNNQCGDCVVVTNCKYLVMHGDAWNKRLIRHHTGYPGGLKTMTHAKAHEKDPTFVFRRAVFKMMPRNKRRFLENLHLFPENEHPFHPNLCLKLDGPSNFSTLTEFSPEQIEQTPRIFLRSDFLQEEYAGRVI